MITATLRRARRIVRAVRSARRFKFAAYMAAAGAGLPRAGLTRARLSIAVALGAMTLLAHAVVAQDAGNTTPANSHWYLGTYSHDILVWDEESEEVIDRIKMRNFIPRGLSLNHARDRLYVADATAKHYEVVDLATHEVVDEFTLSRGDVSVRISSFAPSPDDRRAVLFVKRYTKLRDRYSVQGPFILEYDLMTKEVTDTIPFPDGQEREGVGFQYSPDGETLYFFTNDIIAVDADTYEEVDRWRISRPLEPGLGRASFGTGSRTYDEPGVATGIYRMTDPAQNRRLMGIARVRLSEKEVDFFTVGESSSLRGFALAPDGESAFSLLSEIGRYEFWEFDLEERRLARRMPFAGRPRMGIRVSADGTRVFIHVAGNTIDVYDRETLDYLRTITLDEDMTGTVVLPVSGPHVVRSTSTPNQRKASR